MTNKKNCFVIQPFIEPYNTRFRDIYKPGIEVAGFVAYRVDEDKSANIITETIENGIRDAHVCFADISEDNPNVWYELGFAYACKKLVVMVCNKNIRHTENLPFDIKVKSVVFYSNTVDSDRHTAQGLMHDISKRVKSRLEETGYIININELKEISKHYIIISKRNDTLGNKPLAKKYCVLADRINSTIDSVEKLKSNHDALIIHAKTACEHGKNVLAKRCYVRINEINSIIDRVKELKSDYDTYIIDANAEDHMGRKNVARKHQETADEKIIRILHLINKSAQKLPR